MNNKSNKKQKIPKKKTISRSKKGGSLFGRLFSKGKDNGKIQSTNSTSSAAAAAAAAANQIRPQTQTGILPPTSQPVANSAITPTEKKNETEKCKTILSGDVNAPSVRAYFHLTAFYSG